MKTYPFFVILTALIAAVVAAGSQSIDETIIKANAGDANSQFSLGLMYYWGRGVEQDYNEARKWFTQAANQGCPKAQFELAQMYEKGLSVVQNYNLAFEWYLKAATANFAKAQYSLGKFYAQGLGTGKHYSQAIEWLTKAANQGLSDAQLELGLIYLQGRGVEQDDSEAQKWLTKAALQNNAQAQYHLGLLYCKDRADEIQHDYKEAVKWFSKAGAQNYVEAQYLLGVMYNRGEGVPQDYKIAAKWFTKAASQGSSRAQLVLGACYWNGRGVPIDRIESLKWISLAAINGNKDARLLKDEICEKMTDDEIRQAQQRINKIKKIKGIIANKNSNAKDENDNEKGSAAATGFFVTPDGYILTAFHVVARYEDIRVFYNQKQYKAKIVDTNESIDAALLKIDGNDFTFLPVSSEKVQTGDPVFTVGFPQISLQGTEPKFTEGSISSLSGSGDNPQYFQISVPVQPGNSGGPLINQKGEVIGLVTAKLNDLSTLFTTGALPQNVNYALKNTFIASFLRSIPGFQPAAAGQIIDNRTAVIERAKQSVVLITVQK